MKVAIFYEGDCEGLLLRHFFWNYCSNLEITEDVIEFMNVNGPSVLLYNCGGYHSVFPAMHEHSHLHNADCVFLSVRDTEKTKCYALLKEEGAASCSFLSAQAIKWAIFSKPNLEALYAANRELFKVCVESLYKRTFGNTAYPPTLSQDISSLVFSKGLSAVEELFNKYNISFNKKRLAEKFFSQFDFKNTQDLYFLRLKVSLSGLCCNNI